MSTYVQEPPFCVQVEFTEGCNLRCTFCGLNGIRGVENNLKFMTLDTANEIISSLKSARWNPRVEFAMHGEPSLNPDMLKLLDMFRRKLPKNVHLMMTSNGAGFMKDPTRSIDKALESLNVLALDWYENVQIVPTIMKRYAGVHVPTYYPEDPIGNPHRRRKPNERSLVIVQDIKSASKGTHATLNNHCGCGSPKNDTAQGLRCAKPFRELSIRWDGSVAICCNDWRGVYRCGNIHESSLSEIWNGDAMHAARRRLYHGRRDFGPCLGCDARSYRTGLLPDKMGKESVDGPYASDDDTIADAMSHGTLTLPVLRPWESNQ